MSSRLPSTATRALKATNPEHLDREHGKYAGHGVENYAAEQGEQERLPERYAGEACVARLQPRVRDRHSIRINKQWRICFKWSKGSDGPEDVEIVDYH